jgi:biofilm PGA synthesis N-glycosyltransferase PgaC
MQSLAFLRSLDAISLILLFWYALIFEIPRYTIATLIAAAAALWPKREHAPVPDLTVSVILVGHNEAYSLESCVRALAEQTIAQKHGRLQVIVVDDGSTDNMSAVARRLQLQGKIHTALRLHQRGGKSAGVNLALSSCRGDIIVIVDIDTTFDRDAFERLLTYFDNPQVGGVSCNVGVRNEDSSLMTRFQTIEYAIGISLGRRISDALGTLSIVSGAFGAFRREAIHSIGGQDVEVGEDADLTMRLRRAGWRIRFAPDALGLTHVPETVTAFIAQRLRWDRGLVTIWLRKFRIKLDPRDAAFRLIDVFALLDVLIFQIALAVVYPFYLVWLIYFFNGFAPTVLIATFIGYALLDALLFLAASVAVLERPWRLLPYLPFYTVVQLTLVRVIRLIALIQELIFRSSYRDPYVPARVMRQVERV